MKALNIKFFICLFISHITFLGFSQEIIELLHTTQDDVIYEGDEKTYFSKNWNKPVVSNVSTPTLHIYRPSKEINNGTSVIIAPGGGFYALSIDSEGTDVAKWLNEKGITAFVLKYRLVPTKSNDATEEIKTSYDETKVKKVVPLSVEDGLTALNYVRTNAETLNINPNKIGFMGFSAGGTVTMGVTYNYNKNNKPNFIVPIYPWVSVLIKKETPQDAPPMFIACASNDGLALSNVDLYKDWINAGKIAELHMYAKGGHGFGMVKNNLPTDNWIQRFYEWTIAEKITEPVTTK